MPSTKTISADGEIAFDGAWRDIGTLSGLEKPVTVYGDFGSGTLTMQHSPDGGTTWLNTDATAIWTVSGAVLIRLPASNSVRFSLSGATNPSISIEIGD